MLHKTIFLVHYSVNGAKSTYGYFNYLDAEVCKDEALEMISELFDPYGEQSYAYIEQRELGEWINSLKEIHKDSEIISIIKRTFGDKAEKIKRILNGEYE